MPRDPEKLKKRAEAKNTKKKRSALFVVIVASVLVHVVGGIGLAAIKIIEELKAEPEFEAAPVELVKPPPPPPPPPPSTKRAQRSMPRPQPLAVKSPQNLDVPAIEISDANVTVGGGRGFGGGLGELGGAVSESLRISFFGMESSGSNVAILFDCSFSAARVFDQTRSELFDTLGQIKKSSSAQFSLIYFGGHIGGRNGISEDGVDPTEVDFWFPRGVRDRKWLNANSPEIEKIEGELESIDNVNDAMVRNYDEYRSNRNAFFVRGTNYFGALNEAFSLRPAPDTVYLIVEPHVAFSDMRTARRSLESWERHGRDRPDNTELVFIVCTRREFSRGNELYNATAFMLNQFNGGNLNEDEIAKKIVISDVN